MAYMCVLNHTTECDGCEFCKEERKRKEDLMRWDRYEEEYDHYRDMEYERHFERSE